MRGAVFDGDEAAAGAPSEIWRGLTFQANFLWPLIGDRRIMHKMTFVPLLLPWRRWLWLGAAYVAIYGALLVWLQPTASADPADLVRLVGAVPFLLGPALALQVRRQATESQLQSAWELVALGSAGWAAAEFFRAAYGLLFQTAPALPSLAEPLTLLGFPLLVVGLLRYPYASRGRLGRERILLDAALIVGSMFAITANLVASPLDPAVFRLTPTYFWHGLRLLADLALLGTAAAVLIRSQPASVRIAVLVLAVGMLILATADLFVTYHALTGERVAQPHLLAGLRVLGVSGLPAAAILTAERGPGAGGQHGSHRARLIHLLQRYLPFGLVLTLFVQTGFNQVVLGRLNIVGLFLASLSIGLLIIRQGMLLGENQLRLFEQVVNSTSDAAFVCRDDGRILLTNPAAGELALLEPDETLEGRSLLDLLVTDESPAPPPNVLAVACERGWSGEALLRRAGGAGPIPIALALDALRDEAGLPTGLVGSARDMTERHRMESELRSLNRQMAYAQDELLRLNAQLEHKVAERTANLEEAKSELERQNAELQTLDRLKSDFVSMVSHELRTPLTNINGGLELLLSRDGGMSLDTREALILMRQESMRLTRVVESILDISSFEAGKLLVDPQPIKLSQVLAALLPQFDSDAAGSRLRLEVADDLPLLLADEQGLGSAIFQLVDNARKYAPDSAITVRATAEDRHARLAVIDHGPGVSADYRERLFERFHRANVSDAQEAYGYGLGLYTVKRFMVAMGGEVGYEDTPSGGATFWLHIPFAHPAPAADRPKPVHDDDRDAIAHRAATPAREEVRGGRD